MIPGEKSHLLDIHYITGAFLLCRADRKSPVRIIKQLRLQRTRLCGKRSHLIRYVNSESNRALALKMAAQRKVLMLHGQVLASKIPPA